MKKRPTAAKVAAPKMPKGPSRRTCGSMQAYQRLLETVPNYRSKQISLEHAFKARLRRVSVVRTTPFKINVIVHVVYRAEVENISDEQINSQIEVLNKDFRAKNSDRSKTPDVWKGLVTDPMIEFELSQITRTKTTVASFGTNDNVKKSSAGGINSISPDKYLNIWVCKISNNILGYAQFPGGPSRTDGVVILNTAFGTKGIAQAPFGLGRTATHEVGHYLNLRHIWGDTEDCSGSDHVEDTPNAAMPNTGAPVFPSISCSNGPHGDMYMNYMDYVDDSSMFMFTKGQVERMHACLEGVRSSIVS